MKKKIKYLGIFLIGLILFTNNVSAASFNVGTGTVCGVENMPKTLPNFTSGLFNLIKILVPVILIIMGMIDFIKAVMASDEEKMKKSQKTFITRAIAAVIIFFVMTIVQVIFKAVDKKNSNGFINCINCILSNKNCSLGDKAPVVIKNSCEKYEGKNCPSKDDYGHDCKTYSDGSSYGGCREKKHCSQYSVKNTCSTKVDDYSGKKCTVPSNTYVTDNTSCVEVD